MVLFDYFDQVIDGIEFLLAIGSIIGLLGVIFGLLGVIFSSKKAKLTFLKLIVISLILLVVCGGSQRGIKYFRIH